MVASWDNQILSVKPRAADAQAELACLKAYREALDTAWRTRQTLDIQARGHGPSFESRACTLQVPQGWDPSGSWRLRTWPRDPEGNRRHRRDL
jgi:hypothetical protein